MNRKKDWLVALGLSLAMIGVANAERGALLELDGLKGETGKNQQKPKDVAPKPAEPQKGLLLPAVQKASDIKPDTPPPAQRSKPNVAAGDLNCDGRPDAGLKKGLMTARKQGEKPLENTARPQNGANSRTVKLKVRKAGEGQARNGGALNQIRTNE